MEVPAVYRDFKFHTPTDFEGGVTGSATASLGMVKDDADADGKPVYTGLTGGAVHVESASSFGSWYHDTPGTNHSTSGKLVLWRTDSGAYVNRHDPNGAQWYNTEPAYYCGNVGAELTDADGNPIPCTSKYGETDCDEKVAEGKEMLPGSCTANNGSYVAALHHLGGGRQSALLPGRRRQLLGGAERVGCPDSAALRSARDVARTRG